MIAIINYGSGNINSIIEILEIINVKYLVVDKPKHLEGVDKIILPGVSAFDTTMALLNEKEFTPMIKSLASNNTPIMGVCVGMQVLFNNSEEGESLGLGLINGRVKKINATRLPHMGWNSIEPQENDLLKNVDCNKGFYFLHSYECIPEENVISIKTQLEHNLINAMVIKNSIVGIQFHPEKSHRNGIELFKNFCLTV